MLGGMTDLTTPATGTHTIDGRPLGRTSLTPHLVASPAQDALAFYRDAFGARIGAVTLMGDVVGHAEVEFSVGALTLSDPLPAYGLVAPTGADAVSMSLALYVPDVDEAVARALELGATLREPVATFVSGDRYASILDPFGVRWAVMTRVEDLSVTESQRRVDEWAGSTG